MNKWLSNSTSSDWYLCWVLQGEQDVHGEQWGERNPVGTQVEQKQGIAEGASLRTGAFDLHGRRLGPFTYSPGEQSSVWPEVIDLKL